jgi:hypothetical protein
VCFAGAVRPVIKFRNYVPKTEDLRKSVVEKPAPPSVELSQTLKTATPSDAVAEGEFVTAGGLEADANAFKGILGSTETIDPVSIAPKKANWDLKRDVEKRLSKLERQTQNAIRELIRTRCATLPLLKFWVILSFLRLARPEAGGTRGRRRERCPNLWTCASPLLWQLTV